MDEQTAEINKLTEELIKTKYEFYKKYLGDLDEEHLLYEFFDRFGCDPLGYYANAIKAEQPWIWIETLLDSMANLLYDDPYLNPINHEYKEACS